MDINVSVVIPMYNAQKWIRATLESVIGQDYAHNKFEIIVVDDASSDDSIAIAQSVLNGSAIKSSIAASKVNQGVSAARNMGCRAACGEWLQLLDADDLVAPDKLRTQAEFAAGASADVAAITSNWQHLRFHDGEWKPMGDIIRPQIVPDMTLGMLVHGLTMGYVGPKLIRKSFLEAVGGFDPTMPQIEDLELMIRLAMAGGRFCEAPSQGPLYFYRLSPTSLSAVSSAKQAACLFLSIGENVRNHLLQRNGGKLTTEAIHAFRIFYRYALPTLYETDRARFFVEFARIRSIDPGFNHVAFPKNIPSKVLGYVNTERLALWLRRARRWSRR